MVGRSAQIALLIINLGVCLLTLSCSHAPFSDIDVRLLHDGDIILRKGNGLISNFIVASLKDSLPYSHCGILLKENKEWKVIHSLARELSETDGVQECSLNDFLEDCDDSCIMVARCKKNKADSIITWFARYYLKEKVPFDYQFSLADSSAFFCSELPLHILKYHCNITLSTKEKLTPFSIFTDTTYFRIIAREH